MGGTLIYSKGTCSLCGVAEVTARHYSLKHDISQRAHFNAVSGHHKYSTGEVRVRRMYCLHCKTKVDGPHEAMAHLKEKHPEILAQQTQEQRVEGHDSEWALANATVGGVFDFLLGERRKVEAEAECLRVTLEELRSRVDELSREREKLTKANEKLTEENTRLAGDNRALNAQTLRYRNGARTAAEFRSVHGELQGRK